MLAVCLWQIAFGHNLVGSMMDQTLTLLSFFVTLTFVTYCGVLMHKVQVLGARTLWQAIAGLVVWLLNIVFCGYFMSREFLSLLDLLPEDDFHTRTIILGFGFGLLWVYLATRPPYRKFEKY
jgi:hypothetical protein